MTETTTRKLVRQEWKPLAGSPITRFVAMPASYSVPGVEWRDSLPGKSKIENEVLGYAEMVSGRQFPALAEKSEFERRIEDEAIVVQWFDTGDSDSQDAGDGSDGSETEEDEEETQDTSPEETDESQSETPSDEVMAGGDALVVTEDENGDRVEVEYSPDDEPYTLPPDADDDDLCHGVLYEGIVRKIVGFGLFVRIENTTSGEDDVSGLIHESMLGLQSPHDFVPGDEMIVELEDHDGGLSFIPRDSESETGLSRLFPEGEIDD